MSAKVDAMFSVREAPWWLGTGEDKGQATILGDHPPWEQAKILAGLDWDPVEASLHESADILAMRERFAKILLNAETSFDTQLDLLALAASQSYPEVDGWKRIARSDSNATLACTQDSYEVIANSEFGSIFDALLGQENVKFETGGCLDGGRRVWMLALLDEPVIIAGDNKTATYPYITLMSRHDARGAAALRATNVRIVCMNTFNVAELQGEQTGLTYSFTHRQNWRDHLDEAREAVTGVRREAAAYQDLAENLMQVKVTPKQEKLFVAEFFPMPPKGEASDRTLANVTSSRNAIDQILAGPTVGEAGIRGTAYGLMQAAGEYSDHARQARSWETRLKRTLLQPEPQKARALQLIREVCELAA